MNKKTVTKIHIYALSRDNDIIIILSLEGKLKVLSCTKAKFVTEGV